MGNDTPGSPDNFQGRTLTILRAPQRNKHMLACGGLADNTFLPKIMSGMSMTSSLSEGSEALLRKKAKITHKWISLHLGTCDQPETECLGITAPGHLPLKQPSVDARITSGLTSISVKARAPRHAARWNQRPFGRLTICSKLLNENCFHILDQNSENGRPIMWSSKKIFCLFAYYFLLVGWLFGIGVQLHSISL